MVNAENATASYTAINAGGSAVNSWIGDTDYNDGQVSQTSRAIDSSHVSNPAPQSVYQSQRYAKNLTYTVHKLVPNTLYNVRLHFAETYFTATNMRVFGINLNGRSVLANFDIVKEAGAANVAIIKSFAENADASGAITISMAASVNNVSIGGIEVMGSSIAPTVAPGISVNVGGNATEGWSGDTDYQGGWIATTTNAINTSRVSNPAPQAVYQSQRVGEAFSYLVPNLTPNGTYTVRLHLVESFFSSSGQRLFKVTLNGSEVLANFDIFAAAGAANIAIAESFTSSADAAGRIAIHFAATRNNASIAGIEIIGGMANGSPSPEPSTIASPTPVPTPRSSSCLPNAANPVFSGCFSGNSPYHHTVASLIAAGASVHNDTTAANYWNNGNPLTGDHINANGASSTTMWTASPADPEYGVVCSAYGICDAATSITGMRVHIPAGAHQTPDSDHHFFLFDSGSGQELDMWGGYNGQPGDECEVGQYTQGVLTCSWGGTFSLHGNGLPAVQGNSGIAGGAAYGLAAITAGDILSGHIEHALGLISPCLDNNGQYPAPQGRSTDSACTGNAASGGNGAEPTLRYGDMLHIKSSVNLNTYPYSGYSQYCKVVVKALQEYGAYADDNASGWGLRLIPLDESNSGWQIILASMIAQGDAFGSPSSASWNSCLNRIQVSDLETITLNQGGDAALPPITSP